MDPEDGDLSGDALVWNSDVDGELGTGEELDVAAGRLRLGSHLLTLRVIDSGELSGKDSISVTIIERGPPSEGTIWVEAGTFTMGSPEDELGRRDDEVQHEVTLTGDFYLMETEVTQAQWVSVMGSNPSHFSGCDECPVETVSWLDLVAYCNTLSGLEGRTPAYHVDGDSVSWDQNANGYRLPTEAEWEYACRAGSTTAFHNGPITRVGCGDPNLDEIGCHCGNSEERTQRVGQKLPNAWGFYDMSGNVIEWCWDRWGSYPGGPLVDPTGPDSGAFRTARGGES